MILSQLNDNNQNERCRNSTQREELQNGTKARPNNTFMLGQQYTFANLPAECSPVDQYNFKLEAILSSNRVYENEEALAGDGDYK